MEGETQDEKSFVECAVVGVLILVVAMLWSGCSSKAGWEFRVGVSPVTHSSQTLQLNQKRRAQYEDRKY